MIGRWSRGAALACALAALTAAAAGPVVWRLAGRDAFVDGRFDGVLLGDDGILSLGPPIEVVHEPDEPRLWAVVQTARGVLFAAGEGGEIRRADGTVVARVPGARVTALAAAPSGVVVAAAADGRLFRLTPDAQAPPEAVEPWVQTGSRYVWDLAFDARGVLWVAAGDPGRLLRVGEDGSSETVYESGDTHVRALWPEPDGAIVVGTSGRGHVVRVGGDGTAFVLYDAPQEEITDVVRVGDALYAAAFGGAGGGAAAGNGTGAASSPGQGVVVRTDVQTTATGKTPRGAVYRIAGDGTVHAIWSSAEWGAYALAPFAGGLMVGTGPGGRLLWLQQPDRAAFGDAGAAVAGEAGAEQVVVLLPFADGELLAGASNPARLLRVGPGTRSQGQYDSPVRDTGTTSRWGTIRWRAAPRSGGRVEVFLRAGNTAEPDASWSGWTGPWRSDLVVQAPPARFVQLRARLLAGEDGVPALERVELAYVPRNLPPRITELQVHPPGVVYRQTGGFEDAMPFAQLPAAVQRAVRAMNGDGSAAPPRSFLGRAFWVAGQQTFSWQADDPNGDELSYRLEFRAEDEAQWKPLAGPLSDTQLSFDTTRLPDGVYRVRLIASDEPANAAAEALAARREAAPFRVDNTPPAVEVSATPGPGGVRVRVHVTDATSLVERIEYSVDGAPWRTVVPEDGAADSAVEEASFLLEGLAPGEHSIVVRAGDTALNRGAGKVRIELP